MNKDILKRAATGWNSQARLNLLREELHHLILQEIDRKGGFKNLCFLGGTALRMIYGLDRFSEDLGFSVSIQGSKPFDLERLAQGVGQSLQAFGVDCEVSKVRALQAVHSCFFKFSNLLHPIDPSFRKGQKLVVKCDVDTNPPQGAQESVSPIMGRHLYKIRHYDLPSLFAGKLHAILYRQYTKGRDLYDFLWYRGKNTGVNLTLLENAAEQTQGEKNHYTENSLRSALKNRFQKVDFKTARQDVERFLEEPHALSLFEKEIFLKSVAELVVAP